MKKALVTGASSGIGEEFAIVLAREGYQITAVARSEDKLKALTSRLGEGHRYLVIDLAKKNQVKTLMKDVAGAPSAETADPRDSLETVLRESLNVGIARTDARGVCLYVNDHWCRITRYLINQSALQVWKNTRQPGSHLPQSLLSGTAAGSAPTRSRRQSASGAHATPAA